MVGDVEELKSIVGIFFGILLDEPPLEGRNSSIFGLDFFNFLMELGVFLPRQLGHEHQGLLHELDDLAEMAADEGKGLVVLQILLDLVLVAEDNNLGLALQLFHVLEQQHPLLVVADDEGRNKLLGLDVGAQVRKTVA